MRVGYLTVTMSRKCYLVVGEVKEGDSTPPVRLISENLWPLVYIKTHRNKYAMRKIQLLFCFCNGLLWYPAAT